LGGKTGFRGISGVKNAGKMFFTAIGVFARIPAPGCANERVRKPQRRRTRKIGAYYLRYQGRYQNWGVLSIY
jgi:hypothetical protein